MCVKKYKNTNCLGFENNIILYKTLFGSVTCEPNQPKCSRVKIIKRLVFET